MTEERSFIDDMEMAGRSLQTAGRLLQSSARKYRQYLSQPISDAMGNDIPMTGILIYETWDYLPDDDGVMRFEAPPWKNVGEGRDGCSYLIDQGHSILNVVNSPGHPNPSQECRDTAIHDDGPSQYKLGQHYKMCIDINIPPDHPPIEDCTVVFQYQGTNEPPPRRVGNPFMSCRFEPGVIALRTRQSNGMSNDIVLATEWELGVWYRVLVDFVAGAEGWVKAELNGQEMGQVIGGVGQEWVQRFGFRHGCYSYIQSKKEKGDDYTASTRIGRVVCARGTAGTDRIYALMDYQNPYMP